MSDSSDSAEAGGKLVTGTYNSKKLSAAITSLINRGARLSHSHPTAHAIIVVGGQKRGGYQVQFMGKPWMHAPSDAVAILLTQIERLMEVHSMDEAADELRNMHAVRSGDG